MSDRTDEATRRTHQATFTARVFVQIEPAALKALNEYYEGPADNEDDYASFLVTCVELMRERLLSDLRSAGVAEPARQIEVMALREAIERELA